MYGFGEIELKVWVPSLKRRYRSFPWQRGNKNGAVALQGSQAFQRGFICRNPPRDDEATLKSLEERLESLRAESSAVCMQRWSFRRHSLSWETSFDWSKIEIRALPGVSQQWGPGLDFKSSGPNRIFHDFSCGPYLQLRIAVTTTTRHRRIPEECGSLLRQRPNTTFCICNIGTPAVCKNDRLTTWTKWTAPRHLQCNWYNLSAVTTTYYPLLPLWVRLLVETLVLKCQELFHSLSMSHLKNAQIILEQLNMSK